MRVTHRVLLIQRSLSLKMKYHSSFALLVSIIPLFFITCSADIRYAKIRSKAGSPVFLDNFEFTHTGRLELNLTHISFSNYNPSNHSHIGFFFALRSRTAFSGPLGPICYLQSSSDPTIKIVHTFDEDEPGSGRGVTKNNKLDIGFLMREKDVYELYFQNCLHPHLRVSMDIRSAMYNLDPETRQPNYLSAGKNYLFRIWFLFMCIYLSLSAFWTHTLLRRKTITRVLEINHVLLCFAVFKVLSFLLELVNLHYMRNFGYAQSFVAVLLAFIWGVFGGTLPLYSLVYCIGSGWPFLLPLLDLNKPIMLIIMIFGMVLCNLVTSSTIIIWPATFFNQYYCTTTFLSHICMDLAFGLMYLILPNIWTTRELLHNGQIDQGKSAIIFRKVKLFRRFTYAIITYLGVSFLTLWGFKLFACFSKYLWTEVVIEESLVLAMYLVVICVFWPIVQNQILDSITNEEEIAAAEALQDWESHDLETILS